ncbi:MAG TPA: helix-turn-helix domain-containing protein [Sphingobium sp.]|nr:helix-turn-helix domain-containing protein [Sphingobium sp.]
MNERKCLDAFGGCALPAALEAMGERWSFLILRAAFDGIVYFEEFQGTLGIARNILSNRLGRLVANGILTREPVASDKRRVAYRLTEKGADLVPVMIALRQWGEKWSDRPPADRVLCDLRDGAPIRPVTLQAADGRPLAYQDLCWIDRDCPPGAAGEGARAPCCGGELALAGAGGSGRGTDGSGAG